ncbi:GNAT family N-acetyltransferase [Boseongicola aestuarii]|jgi:putative acetyltransferase|uniref:Putative N-acetyltransferase YafP n=1 Tax=Boseongicola aestuarii TaxID=1470561 RepID=A0A238J390_9RHOB|nr:GNAT family N-acetyltransferase [Boseongicola aestuarii]SMX24803.1 putative N-acetyltransferase YafP [Boseongicola aestuarii]
MRKWEPTDAEASYAVYFEAVHQGAIDLYDAAQRHAWVPSPIVQEWWLPRLSAARAWVTSDEHGLTGFISLREDGYLDMFFVSSRARGDGTALQLYDKLLEQARASEFVRLTTHASHYLRPFLEKRGWHVMARDVVTRLNVELERFEMELPQTGSQVS